MKAKTVIAFVGLPLSGKTSLAKMVANVIGVHFVDIDEGPANCAPPQEENPARSKEALIRERARMAVAYNVLHAAIEANIVRGFSVIISATYSRQSYQDVLAEVVTKCGGNLKVVWCQCNDTPEEIERRIQNRKKHSAIGGVRSFEHYLEVRSRFQDITLPHIVARTEGGKSGVRSAICGIISYLNQ